jgi:hypothetical protein
MTTATTDTAPITLAQLRLVLVDTPGEGKSLVSLALGIVLAEADDLEVCPEGVPTFYLGEKQEREVRRVIRDATESAEGEGFPGWDKVFPYLELFFPASPDKGFYCTSFCNFAHRLSDGMPLNHECYCIPPLLLRLEMAGHPMMADRWHAWSCTSRQTHPGVRTKGGDDLGPAPEDDEDGTGYPQWVGTFHFGDEEHTIVFVAADHAEAEEMLEGPADELRPEIEAVMTEAGRDPRMAWHDYQSLGVELADSSEAS